MAEKITVRQASREADVTSQRIITLIKEGVIKAEKFGFQYAIDRASFDAWQQKRKKQQTEGKESPLTWGDTEEEEPEEIRF